MDFAAWAAYVNTLSGVATAWPFRDNHAGEPAAKFDVATYVYLFNLGSLPTNGTQATTNGQYVYVLATAMTGDTVVLQTAPPTMSFSQRAANATYTALDTAADAVGAPSLSGIESTLKDIGKQVVIGAAVALAVAYLAKQAL